MKLSKICSQCKFDKPMNEYRKHTASKDGHQFACKECQRKKKAEWVAKNPGIVARKSREQYYKDPAKAIAAGKAWRDANPDKVKAHIIKKRYNLSLDQWHIMFEAQQGKCKICDTHQDQLKKELAVDHCHKTGKVRGLLCTRCNRAVGLLEDSPVLLRKSANYLDSV